MTTERRIPTDVTGVEILKHLGIPSDRCSKATIIIEPDSAIHVICEYLPIMVVEGGVPSDEFTTTVREFEVRELNDN